MVMLYVFDTMILSEVKERLNVENDYRIRIAYERQSLLCRMKITFGEVVIRGLLNMERRECTIFSSACEILNSDNEFDCIWLS